MTRQRAAGPATPEHSPPTVNVTAYTMVAVLDRRRPSNLERRQAHLSAFVAAEPGWRLVAGYADVGSARADRPGLGRLLADATAGWFDLLVGDALDRLSRDARQLASVCRQLSTAAATGPYAFPGPLPKTAASWCLTLPKTQPRSSTCATWPAGWSMPPARK